MEYDVVCSSDVAALVSFVNKRIKAGWKPLGGVTLSESVGHNADGYEETGWTFAQAVVREQCKRKTSGTTRRKFRSADR